MRVEYRLDFEDFLEAQKHRFRRPDYSKRDGAILFGVILIGLAAAIGFHQPDNSLPATSLFIVGGVACLVLGGYLDRRAPHLTREADERQLRHEFDAFGSDSRVFEAEAQGWKVQSAYGEDRRSWTHLHQFKEEERLVTVATAYNWYPLPKRFFSAEDLQHLREWALQGLRGEAQICRTKLRHSTLEWVLGQTWHHWKRHTAHRLPAYVLGILLFVFFLHQAAGHQELGRQLYGSFAAFIGCALLLCEVGYYYSQWCASPDWRKMFEVELFKDRILYTQDKATWALMMKQIVRIDEIPRIFLLYFEPDRFYYLPKSCLSSDAIVQFREIARKINTEGAVGRQ